MSRSPESDRPLGDSHNLLEQIRQGDRDALVLLWDRYRARLEGLIRSRLGKAFRSRLGPEDVLNSVFREVLGSVDKAEFAEIDDFYKWVSRIAVHKIGDKADFHRAQKRDVRCEIPRDTAVSRLVADLHADQSTPSASAARHEEEEILARAFAGLREKEREILLLIDHDQMTFEKAGAKLGCSMEAARKRYARAEEALRQIFLRISEGKT